MSSIAHSSTVLRIWIATGFPVGLGTAACTLDLPINPAQVAVSLIIVGLGVYSLFAQRRTNRARFAGNHASEVLRSWIAFFANSLAVPSLCLSALIAVISLWSTEFRPLCIVACVWVAILAALWTLGRRARNRAEGPGQ